MIGILDSLKFPAGDSAQAYESYWTNLAAMKIALDLPRDTNSAARILAAAAVFHAQLLGDVVKNDADSH